MTVCGAMGLGKLSDHPHAPKLIIADPIAKSKAPSMKNANAIDWDVFSQHDADTESTT